MCVYLVFSACSWALQSGMASHDPISAFLSTLDGTAHRMGLSSNMPLPPPDRVSQLRPRPITLPSQVPASTPGAIIVSSSKRPTSPRGTRDLKSGDSSASLAGTSGSSSNNNNSSKRGQQLLAFERRARIDAALESEKRKSVLEAVRDVFPAVPLNGLVPAITVKLELTSTPAFLPPIGTESCFACPFRQVLCWSALVYSSCLTELVKGYTAVSCAAVVSFIIEAHKHGVSLSCIHTVSCMMNFRRFTGLQEGVDAAV
jgi:hypothetical protein